jgi:tRNA U34 5-methylaminomethyl-2-thiouridine-forming methyltransferase MnmC
VAPDPTDPRPDDAWGDATVVTDDGSRTLASARYGETFRSRRGAHTEARHVFVEGTGVAARLAAGRPTSVLEVGLGAATNLVWTAAAALASDTPLCYRVYEPDPLPAAAWAALGLESAAPRAFVDDLLATRHAWGSLAIGDRRRWRHGPIDLELRVAPIAWLAAGGPDDGASAEFDAIYLDPFSPSVNPEAWAPEVLAALADRLRPGGMLASYTVAGAVRRGLRAAGLEVAKVPGPPGGKGEVLRARKPLSPDGPASGGPT